MANNVQINNLLSQIAQLDFESKLKLIEKAVHMLSDSKVAPARKQSNLSQLRGIGADLWRQVDPDKYLRNEREAWD